MYLAGEQCSPLLSGGSSRRRPLQDKTQVQPTAKIKNIHVSGHLFAPPKNRKKSPLAFAGGDFHYAAYYFAVTMSPFSSAARLNSVPGAGLSAISFLAIIVSASDWINLFIGRAP